MARTWHLFPGGNTAAGFVGFFEDLRRQAARTVIDELERQQLSLFDKM